ncbi:response regulator receiver protein, partial [Actinosynnema sp. NPDC059797]
MTQAPERTALCAFGRCRAPLPPPGPRGGRPFEYCPERDWPGGHTCKQLAAAETALTEALGTATAPHLSGAASVFVDAAGRVLEPMTALAAALEDLRTSAAAELTAASEQVERANAEAARERGLREAAVSRAERADQDKATAETARDAALADARTAREEHAEALRVRERAVAAQRATELELARGAAERDAAPRPAEQAATTAAATVAAITAAADQRVRAATAAETEAREQAAELRAEVKALRHRLTEQDHRLQTAEQAVERVRGEAEQRIERITADAERRVDQA